MPKIKQTVILAKGNCSTFILLKYYNFVRNNFIFNEKYVEEIVVFLLHFQFKRLKMKITANQIQSISLFFHWLQFLRVFLLMMYNYAKGFYGDQVPVFFLILHEYVLDCNHLGLIL
ncbi:hypothetical protein D3C87_1872660 [compost metagenome]